MKYNSLLKAKPIPSLLVCQDINKSFIGMKISSLFPLARRFGLGTMVYNPLAGGLLTGKHRPGAPPAKGTRFTLGSAGDTYRARYWHERLLGEAVRVMDAAAAHGLSPVTASVAWTIASEDVTPRSSA